MVVLVKVEILYMAWEQVQQKNIQTFLGLLALLHLVLVVGQGNMVVEEAILLVGRIHMGDMLLRLHILEILKLRLAELLLSKFLKEAKLLRMNIQMYIIMKVKDLYLNQTGAVMGLCKYMDSTAHHSL